MSANPPQELDAATLISRISQGEMPREFILLAAKGFLPIPQEELVAVLVHLSTSEDSELAETARESLRDLPTRVVLSHARGAENPDQLAALAIASNDAVILEAIIRNRATADETFENLASRVTGTLQDIIVINQERILRRPAILDALLANPALSPDARRRALETREEFFEKKRPVIEDVPLEEEIQLTEAQQAELAALLAEANELPPEVAAADVAAVDAAQGESQSESAFRRISKMTVSQKVMLAFRGGMTERGILVRSRIRLVCSAVLKSPRLTETEVENFASLRNVEDEVLRLIGNNRTWMSKYNIMVTLVKNPKAPIGVVLPLINRLTLKDLKSLSGDKGVSETVRQVSRRLYVARKNQ